MIIEIIVYTIFFIAGLTTTFIVNYITDWLWYRKDVTKEQDQAVKKQIATMEILNNGTENIYWIEDFGWQCSFKETCYENDLAYLDVCSYDQCFDILFPATTPPTVYNRVEGLKFKTYADLVTFKLLKDALHE